MHPRPHKQRALTLIEAMMSATILAVVAVATSQAIVAGQMQTYDALHRQRALTLADSLMDEILRLPYDDPDGASGKGPEAGETPRSGFDNLDDFFNYTQSGSRTLLGGSLQDVTGTAYADPYQVFTYAVSVPASTQSVTGLGGAVSGLLVTVTVTDDNAGSWSLEAFVPDPSP